MTHSATRTAKLSPADTRTRWNGCNFPAQDRETIRRISRYPIVSLTRHALFATVMADFADPRNVARSAFRSPAE